ncbi:MAG TPA: hypothetical protein VKO45_08505 [Methanomicrobiales archaeon]|nr:hypothetical protein [Methanomicrobiales archaeon]
MKLLPVLAAAFLLLLGIVPAASAHCPLCTAGAALGVGVARAYGVDDSIVGLLLGAFVASSGLWIDKLLKRRGIEYPLQAPLLVLGSLLLLAVPLYMTGTITNVGVVRALPGYPSIFGLGALGLDKLFAGLLIGTFLVAGVFTMSDRIIEKRGGKRLFRYQGMILMAISVAIFAVILWAMTR